MAGATRVRWGVLSYARAIGTEMNEAQMAVFGFPVFYFSTKKVFHKDWPVRGGTIGERSLFRIFICIPL